MARISPLTLLTVLVMGLCGCQASRQLIKPDCLSFTGVDSSVVLVSGLIDHREMEPDWLIEEILPDQIDSWIYKRVHVTFADLPDDTVLARSRERWMRIYDIEFRKHWKALLEMSQAGDRFFYYTTPEAYWSSLAGQDGIVLIRKCRIVGRVILTQS